ncbi:hypothetical protein A0H81_07163 [Grifola frondosa]|uniref:DUF6532 domain-containing protein n=1 Tax=Grifola frondosa TaxID=5627 RepID=A0A1C7M7U8_GRIFR|nr:hypothetical protein A0H81_07163 [Grifola frondosa]
MVCSFQPVEIACSRNTSTFTHEEEDDESEDDEDTLHAAHLLMLQKHGSYRSQNDHDASFEDGPQSDEDGFRAHGADKHHRSTSFDEDLARPSQRPRLSDATDASMPSSQEDVVYVRKARKIQASIGKPKAADYEPAAQEVLAAAIKIFVGYLSTNHPYPDKMQELTFAKQAWTEACETTDIQLEVNSELTRMISCYSWHLRGEMKTAAKTFVEIVYGFQMSSKDSVRKRNRALAETLKTNDSFVYRKLGNTTNEHHGLYQNKIIQMMVNKIYYKNKHDDGIVLSPVYTPFPMPALALVLTAIEGAIDEWVPGTRSDVTFSVETYREVFEHHLAALRNFDEASRELGILTKIRTRIADDGRVHAKVDPVNTRVPRSLGSDAFKNAIAEFSRKNGRLSDSESDADEEEDGVECGEPESP